jgi:Undecaprenyl-phosphate glucose phosphotransferase
MNVPPLLHSKSGSIGLLARSTRRLDRGRRHVRARYSNDFLVSVTQFVDAGLVIFSLVALYVLYVGWHPENILFYSAASAMSACLTLALFRWVQLYDLEILISRPALILKLLRANALSALITVGTLFALKVAEDFSRIWLVATHLTTVVLVYGAREILLVPVRATAHSGRALRKVALVGANDQARHLAELFRSARVPWREVVGVFDDRTTRIPKDIDGYHVVGDLKDLSLWVRRNLIDEVIVTLPLSAGPRIDEILDKLHPLPVHIYLGTGLVGHGFAARHLVWLGEAPVLEIDRRPFVGWDGIAKTVTDKIIASALLLLLAPVLVAIAVLVKIDSSGPVLFRQQRYGFNNQLITVFKFRTMYVRADSDTDVAQARRDDPRVTRVGYWLRHTSLDELPQLINVLTGCMSLVGPRPHAVQHNELFATLVSGYDARHKVKPGITGWAQINGLRGETTTTEAINDRVTHDIFYIENWSLWFDVKILLMTLLIVLRQKNAY